MFKLQRPKGLIKYSPYFILLAFIFICIYRYTYDAKLSLNGDNAHYYILAKNLATDNNFTTGHGVNAIPHNHFPPGYPFIMSLFMRIGIASVTAMKLLNGIFLFVSSCLFFQIVRRLTENTRLAVAGAIFMLLSPHLLEYASIMMSEISFLMFTLLSVYLYLRWQEKEHSLKSIYFILMLLSLAMSLYIRSLGLSLVLAFVVHLLIQKRFKASGIVLLFCILSQLPIQIRSNNLGGNTYIKQVLSVNPYDPDSGDMKFSNWVDRFKENSVRYTSKEIPSAIFPAVKVEYKNMKTGKITKSSTSQWLLGIFIVAFALLGIWSLKKFRVFFLAFFISTMGILLLWPSVWFGVRFFLPLIPFTFLFATLGVVYLIQILFKPKTSLIASKKLALFLIPIAFVQVAPLKAAHEKKNKEYSRNWANYFKMGEWGKENLPKDSFIACRKPALLQTSCGVEAEMYSSTSDREEFLKRLKKSKFTHVIIEQLGFSQTGKYMLPVLKAEPEKFKIVHHFDAEKKKNKKGQIIQSGAATWLFDFKPEYGYQGAYQEGVRNGKGIYKYRDGSYVKGTWKNDTLQGSGVFQDVKGRVFEGNWKNGKKHGTFTIRDKEKVVESNWINDTIQPLGYLLDKEGNRVKQIKLK